MNYTFSERTVKKYSVADAVTQAKALVRDKGIPFSVTNIPQEPSKELTLSLSELNDKVQEIVFDSEFYAY